jgi:hypothetical protein
MHIGIGNRQTVSFRLPASNPCAEVISTTAHHWLIDRSRRNSSRTILSTGKISYHTVKDSQFLERVQASLMLQEEFFDSTNNWARQFVKQNKVLKNSGIGWFTDKSTYKIVAGILADMIDKGHNILLQW